MHIQTLNNKLFCILKGRETSFKFRLELIFYKPIGLPITSFKYSFIFLRFKIQLSNMLLIFLLSITEKIYKKPIDLPLSIYILL